MTKTPTTDKTDMTNPIIIGLAGKKRSGKSTAASHLLERLAELGRAPVRVGFADAIKAEVAKLFGPCTDETKAIVRPVYQAVGEAAKNLYGEQFWVDRLLAAWDHHQTLGCDALVIDDVRFPYESKIIQSMGGQVWRIARPSTDNHGDMHPSEIHVDSITADHVYVNEKKVQELLDWVESRCNNFACHD